nr:hypothetical protein [Tanacetum cinerariifolium]
MTDGTATVKSEHTFVQVISVALDDAVELVEVGSGCVSSDPNDVVVALSAHEKGDGLDPSYAADDEPMWAVDHVVALTHGSVITIPETANEFAIKADHVVAPTLGFAITIPETANEFAIKGNHLTLVKGNQFDGRTKTNPHKHVHEFLGICDMFKYRDTENEAVRLMVFPLSLTGEAKTWLDELNE